MSGAEVIIRAAQAGDVPAILPLVAKICALHESWDPARFGMRADVVKMYERWLPERASDPKSVLLVAESAGRIVGYIVGSTEKTIPIYALSEIGYLHDLWVEPEMRGRGVGSRLVDAAVEKFRAIGVRQVRGETAQKNEAARRLVERLGFRISTIEVLKEIQT